MPNKIRFFISETGNLVWSCEDWPEGLCIHSKQADSRKTIACVSWAEDKQRWEVYKKHGGLPRNIAVSHINRDA